MLLQCFISPISENRTLTDFSRLVSAGIASHIKVFPLINLSFYKLNIGFFVMLVTVILILFSSTEHQLVHRATLRLEVNEEVEFEVSFCSDKPLSVKAKISLQVEGNQYSSTIIRVTGEAYQEIVSLDNISRSLRETDQEDDEKGRRRKGGRRGVTRE